MSYILWYHGGMDITAYWLNHKKRDAGEGKVYYFYPYTRCEKDVTPTLFIAGKHYVRIAVSEEEWARLRKLDDKEYNSERRAHNKRWTADIPRLRDEDGEEIDFWSDRAEDRETHYIEGDICEEADRRALVRSFDKTDRCIYRLDRKDFTQQEIARRLHLDQATVELLAQLSEPAKEFFFQRFQEEPNWMQMLCLRIIRELERRVITMREPSGNVFHGMEQAIEELAHRRKMTYDFYLDEILQRKYRLRRNRRMLAYARRIVSKTRDKAIKAAIRQEIASLERDQRKILKDLKRVVQVHRDSLPPEIAAKIYRNTTNNKSLSIMCRSCLLYGRFSSIMIMVDYDFLHGVK